LGLLGAAGAAVLVAGTVRGNVASVTAVSQKTRAYPVFIDEAGAVAGRSVTGHRARHARHDATLTSCFTLTRCFTCNFRI